METVTFRISGMACGGCAASIQGALNAVNGVSSAEVSLENAVAEVIFDPAVASREALLAAIATTGYRGEPA